MESVIRDLRIAAQKCEFESIKMGTACVVTKSKTRQFMVEVQSDRNDMRTQSRSTARPILFCLALTTALFSLASGQETDKPPQDSINEQTIYIPYDKLREVFERDGRGVFLPYEKFQQLWNEARKNQPKIVDTSAPLGALITDIESTATLGKEVVNVEARIKIELLKEGWHRVPLRLNDAAIRSATIDEKEARVVSVDDGSYELLIAHDAQEAKTIELDLAYAKASTKTGGQSTVSFQSPQAPVNRWKIRTGQQDIDVQIEPMIASSRKSIDDLASDQTEGDEILAFVGAAPEVKILWTPKSEGASGLAALVSAQTQSRFQIDQGVARTSATVALDISRAEIDSVSVTVPADQKVVSVFDRNVKKWKVEQNETEQVVNIELFEPSRGRQSFSLELEKFVDEIDEATISVPQIKVNDVSRNSGMVLVNLSAGLRAEPENKSGLLQLDVAELADNLKKQKWEFAYRYASLPFSLSLNVKKIQPLINVQQWVEIALRPEIMNVELTSVYDIQLAGVFQVDLDIPESFEIREIRPLVQQGLTTIPVDTYYRDANDRRHVIVTLGKKAMGKIGLSVSLERQLDDANLLSPTGNSSEIDLSVPRSALEGVEFSKGSLIIYAPESLQVNTTQTKGLRNESFTDALAGQPSAIRIPGVRPILAFGFSHTEASLRLEAKRRRPQVTVEQVVVAAVQTGVVKYDARLFYNVQYSGVSELRLDVPTKLLGQLRNRSPNVLQKTMDPQPDDVPEGYTAWEITSDNEFFGDQQVRYTWEEKIVDLPLGESTTVSVDRLIPTNVDRAAGQIVFTKSETIDVRPNEDATGLRPIDPQTDLMQGVKVQNAAMAFEFVDDWSLELTATRFELQELKRTSISRALIRAVALRQNELSVQCLYQMRSVGQRLSVKMPARFDAATSFDDQPVRVNGQRVTPERGGKDLIYIPLTGQKSDVPFLLEIRYTIPGNHHQIDLPVFPDEPAVQKVFLCVYLPYERALLHKSGDWTDEAIDEHTISIAGLLNSRNSNSVVDRMFRRRSENVDEYLNWVKAGVSLDNSTDQKFEVDGRPYVFSALRPEPAPKGSLHLRTLNMTLLNVIACGAIALLGLFLVRARASTQIAGGLLILAAMFFVGVFFPLVTEHLFSEALLLTVAVVGLVWLVSDSGRWIREFQQRRRESRATMFTPTTLATDATSVPASESSTSETTAAEPEPPADPSADEGGAQ